MTGKDLSTYRSELMGWAILWIMMLHFGFHRLVPLGFVSQYGYAGVDIFMFVSGFGLFFALDKRPRLADFYRRRLLRIFPAYYLIGAVASFLLLGDTLPRYLLRYTTAGFWTGGIYAEWYVPSIVMLYLLAPLLKAAGLRLQALLAGLLLAAAWLLVERSDLIDGEHYFLLCRIPAFLYGMMCARQLRQGFDMRVWYAVMLAGVPFFLWLYPQFHRVYMYKYLSVTFLMPLFVTAIILLCRHTPRLNAVMRRMGQASLEIYLTQWLFFQLIISGSIARNDLTTIALIGFCTLTGCLLHEGLQRIASYLSVNPKTPASPCE